MKIKTKINRLFQRMKLFSKFSTLVSLIVACSLFAIGIKWFIHVVPDRFDRPRQGGLHTSANVLAVFVLSNREAFDRRETIRNTWGLGHKNVFFVVGEQYCPYPPENRMLNTCNRNNYFLTKECLKPYMDKEEAITRKLLDEPDVILVPTRDDISELSKKVTESYKWGISNVRAEWFLHVEEAADVEVDQFEHYLNTSFDKSETTPILVTVKRDFALETEWKNMNRSVLLGQYLCGLNHIVARCSAQYAVERSSALFEYIQRHNYTEIKMADSLNVTLEKYRNFSFIAKVDCSMTSILQFDLHINHKQINTLLNSRSANALTPEKARDRTYTLFENPSTYLQSGRFDLIIKMVYAHFYVFENRVPTVFKDAYIKHIELWNNFKEYCNNLSERWFDSKRTCVEKRNRFNFISAFHSTIDTIKKFGFNSSISRIPVDKGGFLLNGAHRLAALIVLSKYATFEHQSYKKYIYWGYEYFKRIGLSENTCNLIMLEWMKLQMQLPFLKTQVSIVSIFSNKPVKDEAMRKLVKKMCSKDNGILYERIVNVNRNGVRQLMTHMYGQQPWLETKIQQMLSKFKFSTYSVLFLFVYGKDENELVQCKNEIRKLYNDKIFKSTVHIPDTAEENLMLAEMILNPNSLLFMNHAKDASDCKLISREVAIRSFTPPIKTLPKLYLGNDEIMIDSGAVLGFFGLRQRTDIDILFLHAVNKSILGNRHGLTIQSHTFKFNSISKERAWGEYHFGKKGPQNQWDLFYDPQNYGYCYGMKFVSPEQLKRYKINRNEPNKDQYDVRLISEYLKIVAQKSSRL